MACDIIIAAENAKFGQPEIKLGIIPGAGGTQRLPRAVGKAKAMDLVLTARMMDAHEAERAGLVSRVVPRKRLSTRRWPSRSVIASFSLASVMLAKEAINRAYEMPLAEGMIFERRLFHALFATAGPEGRHGGLPGTAAGPISQALRGFGSIKFSFLNSIAWTVPPREG